MGLSVAAPYVAAAGLPLVMLALTALFRRFYLLFLARKIFDNATLTIPAGSASRTPALRLRWHDSGAPPVPRDIPELVDARRETRAVHAAFVMSAVVHTLSSALIVWWGLSNHGMGVRSALAVASINTASAVGFVLVFLSFRPISMAAVTLSWIVLQLAVLTGVSGISWTRAAAVMLGGVSGGILVPLPALVLLSRRTLRPLIAGFIPSAGLWIVAAASVGIVLTTLGFNLEGTPNGGAVILGGLAMVVGIGIAVWRIRTGIHRRFVIWWTAAVALLAVAEWWSRSALLAPVLGIGVNGSLVFVGWALFKFFLRLKAQGRMPDEVLHYTGCWFVLGVWTYSLAQLEGSQMLWVLLPFVAYAVTLYALLYRLRGRRVQRAPKRLLLLRVFHKTPENWLMDALDDYWRRAGSLETMVGLDLALRALNALALENYLVANTDRQFLSSEDDARERLSQLPSSVAVDGRFPLNEFYGLPATWKYAVTRLISSTDVVLMDLRGLRSENRCSRFELTVAVQRVPLTQIVLLTDDRTDEAELMKTAQAAWSNLPDDSPNQGISEPTLTAIRCAGRRSDDARAMVEGVFAAAFGVAGQRTSRMGRPVEQGHPNALEV